MAQTAIFVNKNISTATSRLRGYNIYQNLKKNIKFFVIKELYQKKKINLKRIKNFFIFFHILKKTKNIKVFYLVKTVYNIDFLIFIILVKFFTHFLLL